MTKFEVIAMDETAIFELLDDCLFANEISQEELRMYQALDEIAATEFDDMIARVIKRALDITIPDGMQISNGTMK